MLNANEFIQSNMRTNLPLQSLLIKSANVLEIACPNSSEMERTKKIDECYEEKWLS